MAQVTKPIVLDETAQAIKDELHAIAGAMGGDTSSVKYDEAQTLTDAQKSQARTNIGAAELGKLKTGDTEYILRIGTTGAAGYITFVLE